MDNASIILEMLSRIQKLEKQVEELQQIYNDRQGNHTESMAEQRGSAVLMSVDSFLNGKPKQRDTTKYLFNGAVYAKNRLVLAVVKDYTEKNQVAFQELSEVFHPSLQGSIGVVERVENAIKRQDYHIRFFAEEEEMLTLKDGHAYVCNQWGILNIPRFLSRVKELGYTVQEIKGRESYER